MSRGPCAVFAKANSFWTVFGNITNAVLMIFPGALLTIHALQSELRQREGTPGGDNLQHELRAAATPQEQSRAQAALFPHPGFEGGIREHGGGIRIVGAPTMFADAPANMVGASHASIEVAPLETLVGFA